MIDPATNPGLASGSTTGSSTPLRTDRSYGLSAASTGDGQRIHRFAGTMHRAIDSIEQRLTSAGGGVSSTQARYSERARQYGDRLRSRMNEQPLQSTGMVLAAGVLLDRLFLRRPKARMVQVPVRTGPSWGATPASSERHAQRWSNAADARLQRIGRTGQHAADRVGMTTGLGLARAKAAASNVARQADALPLQIRAATQRFMAHSQEYGGMARSTVQAHPWAGLGAVLAASGLLTTMVMRRRSPQLGNPYAEPGNGASWQRSDYDVQTRAGGMRRPLTSGAVVLGLGILASAMLRRRMR